MEPEASTPLPIAGEPPRERVSSVTLGYAFAASGAALFSTKGIIIKLAYAENVSVETLLALRLGLALPIYLVIGAFALRDRFRGARAFPSRTLVLQSAGIGVIGYWFASYADFAGLQYITAQFDRLILFTYPLFVVLFGALFFAQRVRLRTLVAFAVSYAGIMLLLAENLSLEGEGVIVGAAFVLASAIAFAFYQLLAKEAIASVGPRLFTCIAMAGATLAVLIQFFLTEDAASLLVTGRVFGYGVLLAIFATVLPSFLLSEALHRISAQANGVIGTLSPLVTILLAAAILDERLTPLGMAGAALVLAGVGWFTLSERGGAKS